VSLNRSKYHLILTATQFNSQPKYAHSIPLCNVATIPKQVFTSYMLPQQWLAVNTTTGTTNMDFYDGICDSYDDSVSSVHSSIAPYPPSSRPPTPFSYTDSRPPTPSDAPYNVQRQMRSQWESSHSRGGSPALSVLSNWTRSSTSSSTRIRDLEHENESLRAASRCYCWKAFLLVIFHLFCYHYSSLFIT
jgi:hypothetical protein